MTAADFEEWLLGSNRTPLVMGVLNVTPDSFSDGGRFTGVDAAVAHARRMAEAGADLIDIGGESTRPGSARVEAAEQIRRVRPVIEALAKADLGCVLSIDTTLTAVAEAALDAGATLINDISGGSEDEGMLALAARRGAPIVLMHKQGEPATMQVAPHYRNVVEEVEAYLLSRAQAAQAAGVARHRIILDPGIGFGKTVEHNLALLRDLGRLAGCGYPLLLGTSRKGFLGRITGESEPGERLWSTAGSVAWCVANGAGMVRVHDVEEMVKVVRVIRAIMRGNP